MIEKGGAGNAHISTDAVPTNQTILSANEGVRSKLTRALKDRTYNKNGIIPFPEVSRVWSWWRVSKEERDELLYELQQDGYLRIIPYHGVRLEEGV